MTLEKRVKRPALSHTDFPRYPERARQVDIEEGNIYTSALTLVTLILGNLLGDVLYLQQQLYALNGRDSGLRDSRSHTTGYEILGESHGIRESRHRDGLIECACVWVLGETRVT